MFLVLFYVWTFPGIWSRTFFGPIYIFFIELVKGGRKATLNKHLLYAKGCMCYLPFFITFKEQGKQSSGEDLCMHSRISQSLQHCFLIPKIGINNNIYLTALLLERNDIIQAQCLAGSQKYSYSSENDWHPWGWSHCRGGELLVSGGSRELTSRCAEFCKLAVERLLAWWEYLYHENQQGSQSGAFLLPREPIAGHLPAYHWLATLNRWDPKRLSNWPKVTQQIKSRNGGELKLLSL